jgi:2-polyprenyl-3-methyl-5-hydroxy-6-metoxy-1,4-benzoquinol methylase
MFMGTVKRWDAIYKRKGRTYVSSLEYLNEILKLFQTYSVKNVLDLGCGSGGYLVSLAKNGFEVYGLDFSKEAVDVAKSWLKEEGCEGNLKIGSIYEKLPYADHFFDAVISFRVIHHATIDEIRKLIKELERVLKPQGLIFVTVPKWRIPRKKMGAFKMYDSRTFIFSEGDQKDVMHYLFNKQLLKKEFNKFNIKTLRIDHGYYCLMGVLKATD